MRLIYRLLSVTATYRSVARLAICKRHGVSEGFCHARPQINIARYPSVDVKRRLRSSAQQDKDEAA